MLRLSKKADYALIAMKHLAVRGDRGTQGSSSAAAGCAAMSEPAPTAKAVANAAHFRRDPRRARVSC